jgi:DNA polymerase III sliding clamp (beta) subunit (PCNA family)
MKKQRQLPALELICSKDDLRPALQCINIKNGFAYATDAHILIKTNLNETSNLLSHVIEQLEGKMIHMDLWKKINDSIQVLKIEDDCVFTLEKTGRCSYQIQNEGSFPDCDALLDKISKLERQDIGAIGINASMLMKISKLIGSESIRLDFSGSNNAICIRDAFGMVTGFEIILMPILLPAV